MIFLYIFIENDKVLKIRNFISKKSTAVQYINANWPTELHKRFKTYDGLKDLCVKMIRNFTQWEIKMITL